MKILVLNPPYHQQKYNRVCRFDHIAKSKSLWLPIHLAYCTGLLEKHGHTVKLVDAVADELSLAATLHIVKNFSPELIVMNYSKFSSSEDEQTAQAIRNLTDAGIVVVGASCQCIDIDSFLKNNPSIDGVIRGEFDFPVLTLANETPKKEVQSLSWRDNGRITHNQMRSPATSEELEGFPFVVDVYRRHLNIRKYRQAPQLHPFVDTFTGRGCYYNKCLFCLWACTFNQDAGYRTRSIENVISEFKFIKEKMPYIKEIFIQDDTFPAWRAKELATALTNEGLDVTWSCYARPDKTMTYETLKLMKQSGCRSLHVGYESANQKILDAVQKGTDAETMMKFTENAYRAGLKVHADLIIGLPYETIDTIKATIQWAKKLKVYSYQFITPKVYENTSLYDLVVQSGGQVKDGEISYPYLSNEEINKWARIATKECLLNVSFIRRLGFTPSEWGRIIRAAIDIAPYLWKG